MREIEEKEWKAGKIYREEKRVRRGEVKERHIDRGIHYENVKTHTHTQTDRQTDRQTHTHTDTHKHTPNTHSQAHL